jgi:mRNA-degrading endonuclease toxin of MazEF toxin-antitoxin module
LPKDSVVNITQLLTIDQNILMERVSRLPSDHMAEVDAGLKLVLDLP